MEGGEEDEEEETLTLTSGTVDDEEEDIATCEPILVGYVTLAVMMLSQLWRETVFGLFNQVSRWIMSMLRVRIITKSYVSFLQKFGGFAHHP
jgi:hypothetical protein